MRADELDGKKVINDSGEEIGKVDSIVREKTTKRVAAVVSVGGFLGIGDHKVTIALQDMGLHGDRLMAPAGTTKEKVKSMPEYDESHYDKVPDAEKVTVGSSAGSH
jgi:hypothetical protein